MNNLKIESENNEIKQHLYVIRGYKLFRFLEDKGIKMVKEDKDRNNSKFKVFLFEKNDQLLEAIDEFMAEKH